MRNIYGSQWGEDFLLRPITRKVSIWIIIWTIIISCAHEGLYYFLTSTTLKDSTKLGYEFKESYGILFLAMPKFLWPSPCTETISYDIGSINKKILEAGLDEGKLLNIIRKAESQWEYASGRNLFEHKPGSKNQINFFMGLPHDPGGETTNGYGIFNPDIDINIYLPDAELTSYRLEKDLEETLLHEMGHMIGMPHLDGDNIMNPSGRIHDYDYAYLSNQDITLVQEFCEGGIRSVARYNK